MSLQRIPLRIHLVGAFILVLATQGCALLHTDDSTSSFPGITEPYADSHQDGPSVTRRARFSGHRVSTQDGENVIVEVPGTRKDESSLDEPFYDPFAKDVPEVRDPWESFNTSMFTFNRKVDQYMIKPVATGYDKVVPTQVERGIENAFHNFGVVSRLVNNLLQAKYRGAGVEVSRFVINSTLGVAGFFDVAQEQFDLATPHEDLGQTLAVYGVESGPYVILPFLAPLTVRDTATLIDGAMNPAYWILIPVAAIFGINAGERLNDRALNLEFYEGVEESTVDLYGAVRDAYLQSRAKAIRE